MRTVQTARWDGDTLGCKYRSGYGCWCIDTGMGMGVGVVVVEM